MENRGDVKTFNEKFLLEHNAEGEALATFCNCYEKYEQVKADIASESDKSNKSIVFVKEHAWVYAHLIEQNLFSKMTHDNAHHIILFREPRSAMQSFVKAMSKENFEIRPEECSLEGLWQIYNHLKLQKQSVTLVNADYLCTQPKKVLKWLCNRLEIKFNKRMLNWKAPNHLAAARSGHWFTTLASSDRFMPLQTVDPAWQPPVLLRKTLDLNLELYKKLMTTASSDGNVSKGNHLFLFSPCLLETCP